MNELDNTQAIFREFSEEIDLFAKPYTDPKTQLRKNSEPSAITATERRLLIRSIFSFFEAIIFQLKATALISGSNSLSPEEIALAKEEDYELKDSGQVQIRKAKLKFLPNFRFAFAIMAKANRINYELNVSCLEWEALRRTLFVRDRLMHPKNATDLVVTDDETKDALIAYEWVYDQIGRLAMTSLSKHRREHN